MSLIHELGSHRSPGGRVGHFSGIHERHLKGSADALHDFHLFFSPLFLFSRVKV